MLVASDRAPVTGLTTASGLAAARVIAVTALLGGCAGSPGTTGTAQAPLFDTSLVQQASATFKNPDTVKYCPDGLVVTKKDLDTGLSSESNYQIDGNFCSVDRLINGEKKFFHSVLGLVPPREYSNFSEGNSKIISILTTDISEVDFYELGSNWGAPSRFHTTVNKIGTEPVSIGNKLYPSIQLEYLSVDSKGKQGNTFITFSNIDGKYFASKVKSGSPDHVRENFIITQVGMKNISLKTAGL